jgi:hypothetical protein
MVCFLSTLADFPQISKCKKIPSWTSSGFDLWNSRLMALFFSVIGSWSQGPEGHQEGKQ